jgi:hypothetical protein
VRRIATAVVASVAFSTTLCGFAATARADDQCTGQQGANPAAAEFYQTEYNPSVAEPVARALKEYNAAAASGDPQQTGQAARTLYNEISADLTMFRTQTPFGCYDATVLASLQLSTTAFAATLDGMSHAAARSGGKTPGDIPGLVAQAKPQEMAYVNALNAYASQFGGQKVAQP